MKKQKCISFAMAIVLTGLCFSGWSADRYVTPPGGYGTNNPPYTNWADAATNIQWAVDAAAAGETIWVTNGAYCLTNQIMITNSITVKSFSGNYSNTLVYAGWPTWTTRCFYITRTGIVDGFTISNGHCYGSNDFAGGGGAYVTTNGIVKNCYFVNNVNSNSGLYAGGGGVFAGYEAVVSNCLFFTNKSVGTSFRAGYGGAILMWGGKVYNSTIISNYAAGNGGGVYAMNQDVAHGATPHYVSNCSISYCYAGGGDGAGMNFEDGTVANCTFSYNTGPSYCVALNRTKFLNSTINNNNTGSSALRAYVGALVSNCIVSGNSSGIYLDSSYQDQIISCQIMNNRFCGIYIKNGNALIRNCLISNNTNLTSNGGGVIVDAAVNNTNQSYGLINCTIAGNWSTNEGGGIAMLGTNSKVNCIIAGNNSYSGGFPNVYNTGDNSNYYWYSCATGARLAPSQGNITNDPVFVDPSVGNWRLKGASPCINAGTNISWMTNSFDLDGRIRLRYGTVDMGTYEAIYEGAVYKAF